MAIPQQSLKLPLYKSGDKENFIILGDTEEGRKILLRVDDYISGLSEFDLMSKSGSNTNVTAEYFVNFQAASIMQWTDSDLINWTNYMPYLQEKLSKFSNLPLPSVIHLNLTTGEEEANAAYTRGDTGIFLPKSMISWRSPYKLLETLTHEIWHIISRMLQKSNPQLRDRVYNCIGFLPLQCIFSYPPQLVKISNPDAPLIEHYCQVTMGDGSSISVFPVIHSSLPVFNPDLNLSFFDVMLIQLLVVTRTEDGTWVPVTIDGKLDLRDISDMPEDFWRQVGRNTSYMIHPEETIADNFKFLIHGTNVKNPEILEKMRAIFQ